jgi:hypothetical protein
MGEAAPKGAVRTFYKQYRKGLTKADVKVDGQLSHTLRQTFAVVVSMPMRRDAGPGVVSKRSWPWGHLYCSVPTVSVLDDYGTHMNPGKPSHSLTELIDQLDNIREDLLRIQHSLENMEPEHASMADGDKDD